MVVPHPDAVREGHAPLWQYFVSVKKTRYQSRSETRPLPSSPRATVGAWGRGVATRSCRRL
jgi:hypothetical protein